MVPPSPRSSDICPRCEDAILAPVAATHEILVCGSTVRVPDVQVDECPKCRFQSLSASETGLFQLLFGERTDSVEEMVQTLRSTGHRGMFLREDQSQSMLAFGARDYVAGLDPALRGFYLDNESSLMLDGLSASGDTLVQVELPSRRCTVRLPKIGEGENGVVYEYEESDGAVLKLAKPRAYSRDHILVECEVTEFFDSHGVPVPRIVDFDPHGNFAIKERLDGESLATLYDRLGAPDSSRHRVVRASVQRFCEQLIEIFGQHPGVKTSISPNNIFVVLDGSDCRCLLVDTGPAPLHDYSTFDFATYWQETIPQKIARYRQVGYI